VAPGDRVAIMLEPSLAFYATLFGAMKAGAVAVPLFTLFGPEGLRLRLDDCAPRVLVTTADLAPLAAGPPVIVADRDFLSALRRFEPGFTARTAPGDLAMYQYTSGTTRALPEAVKHPHRALVTVLVAALHGTGIRPGDRFLCPSSPAWGHGLWHGTLAPLALGVTTGAWAGPFDPVRLLEALEAHRVTNLSAAATHYRMLRNTGRAARHHYVIEKASFTGEPMDPATAAFVQETFGVPACSMYGTTEVGVILASYPGAPDFAARPGALGKPLPGTEVAVLDSHGRPCAPGEIGEIAVRRRGGWVPTRDRGWTDRDGYFYHGGRADDVIISAGWTMSPVEIEGVLLAHPDVDEAAVIGVPDALRGEVAKAFVVSRRPPGPAFAQEIQEWTRTRLSRHEYPRQVEFTRELPKTPAGKVNRHALRQREPGRPPPPAPGTS
jgi:acetyl-CoA synthetase